MNNPTLNPHSLMIIGAMATFTGFINGDGQTWLDNVQCSGSESRLIDCPADPLGTHNCVHTNDVGVRCQPIQGNYILNLKSQGVNSFSDRYESSPRFDLEKVHTMTSLIKKKLF